jgi:DNA-binding protein
LGASLWLVFYFLFKLFIMALLDAKTTRVTYPLTKESTDNDVYISKKTAFVVQINMLKKLLETKADCIRLHAVGPSIPRAVALADTLNSCMGNTIKISTGTTTTMAVDEFDSLHVERSLTKIIIRITRVVAA